MRILCVLAALIVLTGCSTAGLKSGIAEQANMRIGLLPTESKSHLSSLDCGTRGGVYGCLYSQRNCEILFSVSQETGRITAWRYLGDPTKCWKFR